MKKSQIFLVSFVFVIMASLLATGCATGAVLTHLNPDIPFEDHARIYIDGSNRGGTITRIGIFGINGNTVRAAYQEIAGTGEKNVLILPHGEHILNVATNTGTTGFIPAIPGMEYTITVEAGKYYRLSVLSIGVQTLGFNRERRTSEFFFEDIDNPLESSGDTMVPHLIRNTDAFKAEIDRIVNISK